MLSQSSKSADCKHQMKSGSTFSTPPSWKAEEFENRVKLNGPESDFVVNFLELPLTDSIEKMLEEAWRQINPNFTLKPSQQFSHPVTWFGGGWESVHQIMYDVPASEGQVVMAFVRIFKDKAYLNLVDGKMATLHRRGAELHLMMDSWKPCGFQEVSLDEHEMRVWSAIEKQEFDHFIQEGMQKLKIPGMAIAIVQQDGKILFSKGYGIKKLNSEEAVTIDTPFMIGSTTKALTTLLMGTLVDQKKLTWDLPVTEVLHNFSLGDKTLTQQLTARLTVSASTGMPRRDLDFIFNYSDITPEARLAQMKEMKPTTGLGETFQYSNFLFMVGGYMAAHAYAPSYQLEEAYAKAMQDLVFEPLMMKNTTLKASEAIALGAAFPHSVDFNGELREIPLALENACYSIAPAGAVWSTVRDLSQYLIAELNNGVLNGKQIISKEAIDERRKPAIRITEKSFYGLGLMGNNDQGLQMLGHGGGTMGFSSDLFFYPEKGVGVVILANSRYAHPFLNAVKQKFLELTFAAKPQAEEIINISVGQQEEMKRKNWQDISLESEKLKWVHDFVGEYSNFCLGDAKLYQTQEGYEIAFKEWKSRIGSEVDKKGKQYLVLIDPPSYGALKLQAEDNGNLILDAGQEQYEFTNLELSLEKTYPILKFRQDKERSSSKHRF